MSSRCLFLCLIAIVFSVLLGLQASAHTDLLDVQALQDLHKALNTPSQLKGWKADGGDPCEESWTGVSCSGSSVILIKIPGFELNGSLGSQLSNLHNLKQLDVSSNHIQGEIPYSLPLNITHLNLAGNKFIQSIPYSLTTMKHLRHLNLSHNLLSGPIGNVFTGLTYLREMDLSYNNFTGDLPSSFGSLTNLTRLFLESNEFTGSVIYLADLPLSDLDIQDNHFSGVIPEKFQSIHNLWLGGNKFRQGESYTPWKFPSETMPNISSPPSTESSAIESYPSHKVVRHKKKGLGPGGLACLVGGVTLVATFAAFIVVVRVQRSRGGNLRRLASRDGSWQSIPVSTARDCSSSAPEDSPAISIFNSPPLIDPSHLPPIRTKTVRACQRRSFSRKSRNPIGAKHYSVAELQSATNCFSEDNLLGEGSVGSVYKAEFPNGQIFAVKNINTVVLALHEEEQFMDVIWNAARLRHPNIVKLVGYCVEHGQHLLVYEYVRNLSLDDALHCDSYMPLSWGLRLRVALGVARSLNYLHSTCMPPVAHSNIKAANILLDEDLMPRICDCGLAVLKPLTSNSIKVKASEMAICDTGYIAPEHVQPGIGNTKGDIYAFGVLLLELFTGRKPFDSSKPKGEQSLVNWASPQLHDKECLERMVDPAIKRTIPSKALSRFADTVSLCIQREKELRPPMSEIVESLMSLLQEHRTVRGIATNGTEVVDQLEKSFRSTNSRFIGSPTVSYLSI